MRRWALIGGLLGVWACDDGAVSREGLPDAASSGAAEAGPIADAAPAPDEGVAADLGPAADAGPAFVRPRFAPGAEAPGFYDTPWPSDARLMADGAPDLSDFPALGPTFGKLIEAVHSDLRGFATMPVVFVAFDHPIADLRLPAPAASVDPASPIQLLALGDACGQRVPVETAIRTEADRYIGADTLQIKNTVGTVLEPGRPYGLVVRTAFGADQGRPARAPQAFSDAWAGDGTRWAASLQPLRDCLPEAGLVAEDIAVATVFTPQDPVAELQAMHDVAMDVRVTTRPPLSFARDPVWSRRRLRITTHTGLVEMPNFQRGETPYTDSGGGLVRDADGRPMIQRWEPVPFAIAHREFPEDAPFEGPRPALVFMDGTGWSPWSHLRSGWLNDALDAGFVVFSFMPQFHGERAGYEGAPDAITFNFVNPEAGRTNFRQQALENAYFTRVIREHLAGLEGLPEIDTGRLVYGGHSQGALAGALTAAVTTSYAAYVLNGLSSYLSLTVLARKDLLDFERVVRGLLVNEGPLDLFAPALAIMQMASEVVDPHNFARLWRGSAARPKGNPVFVINGFNDDTTTPRGIDHLTISADLPTLDPPGWDLDPLGIGAPERVSLPLVNNATGLDGNPITLATYLDPQQGHFTIYRNSTLRQLAVRFWQTAWATGAPRLEPERELMCGDGADGDADGAVDCDDADCAGREPCVETRCDDARDGDGNGLADCDDPACAERAECQEPLCDDGEDEDGDGLIDCDDPGCAGREPCRETRCRDRADGDDDGLIDCDDPDCQATRDCHETACTDEEDNDRDGLTDCEDDECAGTLACPEPACDDGTDEDGDGRADCADPRCYGAEVCPTPAEVVCDDGEDDDADGLLDCADPDCAGPTCPPVDCADADLGQAVGVAVFQGSLEGRADTWPPGDCTPLGAGKDAPDVALRWAAPASGVYRLSTLGSEADTVLTLYPDACPAVGPELACHDDQPGVASSAIDLQIEAGQSVLIVVSGYGEDDDAPVVLHVLPSVVD